MFVSHSTSPVLSSSARKLPATSPPNTSPPPVVTSDITPTRCSCLNTVLPVSAEMPHTTPIFSAPGAGMYSFLKPYTSDGSRSPVCTVAFMHMFCMGMYMLFVRGLYAPAGQFLPPFVPGQT